MAGIDGRASKGKALLIPGFAPVATILVLFPAYKFVL